MAWFYYTLKAYLKTMHESLMIRHRYTFGMENLPAKGEKYFIVCNHQNCVNDPLNIYFALPFHTQTSAMARADVFSFSRPTTAFLHWIGLVPAFRFGWEGGAGLEHNFESFDVVARRVNLCYPFMVFPEAGHTQGHYLDRFTTGTVRMAFHVAKYNGWKEDIKIVPSASHYEDYFKIRTDFILRFSEPVSLQPYYERFQQHPNSVMREITHMLRDRIQSMMLDEGKDDYEEKDYLRLSALNPASIADIKFPERLQQDRAFVASVRSNPHYADIIEHVRALMAEEHAIGTDDITIHTNASMLTVIVCILLLIIFLPLWIATLFPHAICYAMPFKMLREDKMFTNSYRYVFSALFLYPLFAVLSIIIGTALGWWWQTILWILLWIPGALFCWYYYQFMKKTFSALHWRMASAETKNKIHQIRQHIKDLIQDNNE